MSDEDTRDRRKNDDWQHEVEKRMNGIDQDLRSLTAGQRTIIDRQDRHEKREDALQASMTDIGTRFESLDTRVGTLKHELASNTLVTDATSVNVRSMKMDVASISDGMKTLSALNAAAAGVGVIIKRVAPVLTAIGAIWAAFAAFSGWHK